ncbi:MAG TPA: MGMT family protein [Pyrinomonadaceae bacterium]|jgi:methylated-DNA-protein-cysteine methyltransferase-like protein
MAQTNKPADRQSGGGGVRADERALIAQPGYNERVYEIVRRIPAGQVMTYGQIADLLGEGYTPRTVGFVMHAAPDGVPWHRVINAQGAVSTGRVLLPHNVQQSLLEAEGVAFDARGRCDLKRLRWTPEEARDAEPEDEQGSLFG